MSKTSSQNSVPVVETERLILRAHKLEDFEHFFAMWTDPEGIQYTSGEPLTEEQAWAKFIRNHGLWAFLGYSYWAVEEKSSGQYIGDVGFAEFKRNMEPPIKGLPENGWVLARSIHGKGYATEAVKATVAWSDKNLVDKETVCIINPDNAGSIRVAEKCGYKKKATVIYQEKPTLIYQRNRILP